MVSDKIKVSTATLLYVERGSATFQSLSYLDCTTLESTAVGKYCLSYLDYKMISNNNSKYTYIVYARYIVKA